MPTPNHANRIRRLKHIEAFSAVVATGSISAAARQLGVSQPAVSQLIKALEDAVGAPLFVRRNGAIFPTGRAENLCEEAVDLLAHLDRFQAQLNYQRTGLLSTIRISATMSITNELLPLVLANVCQQHPDAKFYVSSLPLSAMVEPLVQGHIDFAFHTRPLEHPGLHNELLAEVPQVAVMSADHPLADKVDLTVEDFQGCRMISSTRNDPAYHYFKELWSTRKVSVVNVLQSPFAGFAMTMVQPLAAVTFNNALMAKDVCQQNPQLIYRPVKEVSQVTPFYLACADWQHEMDTQQLLKAAFLALPMFVPTAA